MRLYSGGTFDLFHYGHVEFLGSCSRLAGGDPVVVAVNTDEFIMEYKKKAPVLTYDERVRSIKSTGLVDEVIPNIGGANSRYTIERCAPRTELIVIGSDWARKDYYAQMGFDQDWLDERGITLAYVPYTFGISSTDLKKRILET